jgi:aryl-phospho-beta-D-glucosidase BglC (GH1 family)
VRPKNKGFGNPFQISPTPCKIGTKPTPKQWGTIREWICAQKQQKNEKKIWKNLKNLGFGFFVGKWGKMRKWGAAVVRGGAEGPAVVRWLVGK